MPVVSPIMTKLLGLIFASMVVLTPITFPSQNQTAKENVKMINSKVMIRTNNGYLTRKGFDSEFSFTNNKNFAYVFDNEKAAERIIKDLGLEKTKIEKFN